MRAERHTLRHRPSCVQGTCAKQRAESAIHSPSLPQAAFSGLREQAHHVCMLPRATTSRLALTHLHSNTDEQLARIVRNLIATLDLGASCESMASPGKQHAISSETQGSDVYATAARCDGSATRRLRDCDSYEAAQALRCRRRRGLSAWTLLVLPCSLVLQLQPRS